jgi:hypothetical protein
MSIEGTRIRRENINESVVSRRQRTDEFQIASADITFKASWCPLGNDAEKHCLYLTLGGLLIA